MQTVTLDSSTRAKLHNLTELLEVRDEAGRVLGHFLPIDLPPSSTGPGRHCPHTDDEIEQLRRQTGGRPLAEIWDSLGRQS
jgi:hypothetical protein